MLIITMVYLLHLELDKSTSLKYNYFFIARLFENYKGKNLSKDFRCDKDVGKEKIV